MRVHSDNLLAIFTYGTVGLTLQVLAMPAVIVILSEKESRKVKNITNKSRIRRRDTLHNKIKIHMNKLLYSARKF